MSGQAAMAGQTAMPGPVAMSIQAAMAGRTVMSGQMAMPGQAMPGPGASQAKSSAVPGQHTWAEHTWAEPPAAQEYAAQGHRMPMTMRTSLAAGGTSQGTVCMPAASASAMPLIASAVPVPPSYTSHCAPCASANATLLPQPTHRHMPTPFPASPYHTTAAVSAPFTAHAASMPHSSGEQMGWHAPCCAAAHPHVAAASAAAMATCDLKFPHAAHAGHAALAAHAQSSTQIHSSHVMDAVHDPCVARPMRESVSAGGEPCSVPLPRTSHPFSAFSTRPNPLAVVEDVAGLHPSLQALPRLLSAPLHHAFPPHSPLAAALSPLAVEARSSQGRGALNGVISWGGGGEAEELVDSWLDLLGAPGSTQPGPCSLDHLGAPGPGQPVPPAWASSAPSLAPPRRQDS